MLKNNAPILVYQDNIISSAEGNDIWNSKHNTFYKEICPYCKLVCHKIFDKTSKGFSKEQFDKVSVCLNCGWWSYECDISDDMGDNPYYMSSYAIMKKFSVDSENVPCVNLANYIEKNQKKIKSIGPVKFEELVKSVYKDVLNCKIESCSYGSHDRGIDIV